MKKLLFLCSFVLFAGMMNAQTTKKACSKKCAKSCSKKASATTSTDAVKTLDAKTQVASAVSDADIAAEADPAISKKVCGVSGNTSFYRESTCAKSGETSLTEVKYCGDSQAFVNVSPKSMEEGETKVLNVVNDVDVEGEAITDEVKTSKKACSKSKKACTKGAKEEQ